MMFLNDAFSNQCVTMLFDNGVHWIEVKFLIRKRSGAFDRRKSICKSSVAFNIYFPNTENCPSLWKKGCSSIPATCYSIEFRAFLKNYDSLSSSRPPWSLELSVRTSRCNRCNLTPRKIKWSQLKNRRFRTCKNETRGLTDAKNFKLFTKLIFLNVWLIKKINTASSLKKLKIIKKLSFLSRNFMLPQIDYTTEIQITWYWTLFIGDKHLLTTASVLHMVGTKVMQAESTSLDYSGKN